MEVILEISSLFLDILVFSGRLSKKYLFLLNLKRDCSEVIQKMLSPSFYSLEICSD